MPNGGHTFWAAATAETYWSQQSFYSDTIANYHSGIPPFGFDIVSLIWTRPSQDNVQIDLAFAQIPATGQCTVLTPTDMASVETGLNTWWTAVKPVVSSDLVLAQYAWHQYVEGATRPGPAVRTTPVNVAGTNGGFRMSDQTAVTVTFRTCSRKHWGRTYQPGLTVNFMSTGGYLNNSTCVDLLAGAYNTLWTGFNGSSTGICLGVGSVKYAGFLRLSNLVVDNIPDVQRRRRLKHPTYEKIYT